MPLLEVRELTVAFPVGMGSAPIAGVAGLSLALEPGEAVALVGPSGCGKTVAGLALLGLVPPPGRVVGGDALWEGRDLLRASPAEWRALRGRQIAMVFQEPLAALHPLMTIGAQVREALRDASSDGDGAVVRGLARVGLAEPERCARSYPHELSGGERQRALLAVALAGRPRLLIADEPTSALDTQARRQVLALLAEIRRERHMALLLITHQEDVAHTACDRLVAMGERTVLPPPTARRSPPASKVATAPLLRARGLVREIDGRRLLDDVDLEVGAGECVAIVGRSGSGKTTLARALLHLVPPDSGEVVFDGRQISALRGKELRRVRRRAQMVFQDPYASLDPRQPVGAAVAEPLRVHRLAGPREASERVAALLERVGLASDVAPRLPHQFSGGQRQRVAIARALACEPELLIADEPVTALDAAARSRILDLLASLRASGSMALILIAHDLAVVAGLADRIVVLDRGRVVESGPAAELLAHPRHEETRRLLGEVV